MKKILRISFVLIVSLVITNFLLADTSDVLNDLKSKYLGKDLVCRKSLSPHPVGYVLVDDIECTFRYKQTRAFPIDFECPAQISAIFLKTDYQDEKRRFRSPSSQGHAREKDIETPSKYILCFEYKTRSRGKGTVDLNIQPLMENNKLTIENIDVILNYVFHLNDDIFYGYVINKQSHMIHTSLCNHLPQENEQEEVSELSTKLLENNKKCPICFMQIPPLSDYYFELMLAKESSRMVRYLYPVAHEDKRIEKVQILGNKILSNWPVDKKGYNYSFHILDSEDVNAVSIPCGEIYVFSGLLDSLESDEELEAVLAHEIAHIEARHMLKAYKKMEAAALLGAIAGGVITAAAGVPVDTSQNVILLISNLTRVIVFTGYSKECEREADTLADIYFEQTGRKMSEGMKITFGKLKYHDQFYGDDPNAKNIFATHPTLDERLEQIESGEIVSLGKNVMGGYNMQDELIATATVSYGWLYKNKLKILLEIETTENLERKITVGEVKCKVEDKKYRLRAENEIVLDSNESSYATFSGEINSVSKEVLTKSFEFVEISGFPIKYWTRLD